MNSNITIALAVSSDAPGIQKVLKDSSRAIYITAGYSEEDLEDRFKDSLLEPAIKRCAENLAALANNQKYIVAKKKEEVIALCYGEKQPDKNILHALYVSPDAQGQGLGKKLWDIVKDFFDPMQPTILEVFASNEKAIEFYKNLGFIDRGKRTRNENFKSKSGVEIIEMEMELLPELK